MSQTVQTLTTFLAATDSRDKAIKGAGAFFKLLGAETGNANYLKLGASMSECRSLMRLLGWISNVQKLSDALEKRVVSARDVIFVLRVLFDGVFSLLDNVVYVGRFFEKQSAHLTKLSKASRASLFYGYVAAVALDIYDLTRNYQVPNRKERYLVLTRNTCDMLSATGNATKLNLGDAANAALGLISALIASRELLMRAQKQNAAKQTSGASSPKKAA